MGVAVLLGVAAVGAAATTAAVSLSNTASVNRTNRQIAADTNATNKANTYSPIPIARDSNHSALERSEDSSH